MPDGLPPPLPCIVCGTELRPADPKGRPPGRAFPLDAVVFTSYGHFGSGEFDPADGSYLEVVVCDACLVVRARPEFGAVWHTNTRPGPPVVVFSQPFNPYAEDGDDGG